MLKVCLAFLSTIVTPYRIFKLLPPRILVRMVFYGIKFTAAIVVRHTNFLLQALFLDLHIIIKLVGRCLLANMFLLLDFGMRFFVRDLVFSRLLWSKNWRLVTERKLIMNLDLVLGWNLIMKGELLASSCLFPFFINFKVSPLPVNHAGHYNFTIFSSLNYPPFLLKRFFSSHWRFFFITLTISERIS